MKTKIVKLYDNIQRFAPDNRLYIHNNENLCYLTPGGVLIGVTEYNVKMNNSKYESFIFWYYKNKLSILDDSKFQQTGNLKYDNIIVHKYKDSYIFECNVNDNKYLMNDIMGNEYKIQGKFLKIELDMFITFEPKVQGNPKMQIPPHGYINIYNCITLLQEYRIEYNNFDKIPVVSLLEHNKILIDDTIYKYQLKEKKVRKECIICFKKIVVGCILLPCKHKDYCISCAGTISKCSVCEADIADRIEL